MVRRSVLLCAFIVAGGVAGTVAGCDVGEGVGSLAGTLFVDPCTTESTLGTLAAPVAFNLKPTYFVADPVNDLTGLHPKNKVSIRVQSTGDRVEEADALLVGISNVGEAAAQLGQTLTVGANTNVRASLALNRTCPVQPVQIELDGTIQFTRFGANNPGASAPPDFRISFDDPIAATFNFTAVDRRAITLGGTGGVSPVPTVGGQVSGSFDFRVQQGRGAQQFP
jgi:hypothetical protein